MFQFQNKYLDQNTGIQIPRPGFTLHYLFNVFLFVLKKFCDFGEQLPDTSAGKTCKQISRPVLQL